jgi:hypothetical protein
MAERATSQRSRSFLWKRVMRGRRAKRTRRRRRARAVIGDIVVGRGGMGEGHGVQRARGRVCREQIAVDSSRYHK